MSIYSTGQLANPRFIINFPTKRHWRGASGIDDIESGLEALVQDIQRLGIKTIAIPPLGAGLGGLDWELVREKFKPLWRCCPILTYWSMNPRARQKMTAKLSKLKHPR